MLLSPALKNDETLQREVDAWKTSGCAPWWAPYPPKVLCSIFQDYLCRFRDLSEKTSDRKRWCGRVTAEFVLRGYRLKDLAHGWALTGWSLEKVEMLKRLRRLRKCRLCTERVDLFPGPESSEESKAQTSQGLFGGTQPAPPSSGSKQRSRGAGAPKHLGEFAMATGNQDWGQGWNNNGQGSGQNWGAGGGGGGGANQWAQGQNWGTQGQGGWGGQPQPQQQQQQPPAYVSNPPGSKKLKKAMQWQMTKNAMRGPGGEEEEEGGAG